MSAPADLGSKNAALDAQIRTLGRTLVAYSGGVDSAFLAWTAYRVLGSDMLAVVADSPSLSRTHLNEAVNFAREHGIPFKIVATSELDRPEYVRNDGSRCFHCKDELFTVMESFCATHGFDSIAYGVNVDDQGDFRPGQVAASQHHVAAPLLKAGLTKLEIRELAHCANLRVWDKPASACALGFRQFRVRHHGEIVRIEIGGNELPRALSREMAAEFTRIFKVLGFKFVTLDLEGFRSGSMNSLLPAEQLSRKA
jgi:uncharacterized protein